MPEPDDFGLSPVATLAHVGEGMPAPMHQPCWNRWREAVVAAESCLGPAEPADPSDPTATHRLESVRGVRIGCRLELPPKGTALRAGLVTMHGYEVGAMLADDARRWRGLTARGVAVLCVRVRGYPGSQLDTGDWTNEPASPLGWITHGFPAVLNRPEEMLGWSLPQAAADVACAARALCTWMGKRTDSACPVFLHGESFGAGLALIAAAQVPTEYVSFDRLAIGLPTLGDWAWRLSDPARMSFGTGAQVLALLRSLGFPGNGREAVHTLRTCDAVIHAGRVRRPVLCKLALRDEVVPAPAAAAVFNALGADPGLKWRFVVPEGHADGGLAGARRHALFERCIEDFLDPALAPEEAMAPWESVLVAGDRPPRSAPSAEKPITGEQAALFSGEPEPASRDRTDALLVEAYQRAGRTLDDLPYTKEWSDLYDEVGGSARMREREVFHRLHNLRKAGKLPRMGRAASSPPRIEPAEEERLAEMVTRAVGTLGQRDQLPFTPEFDRLVLEFNEGTGRSLEPHDVWRLIAKLAK
jgi:cephalosporin-C deacetylase-like acetyl esterase